nr:hypothetical protein BaRGS_003770 [Batillaria attramentaria]
MTQLLSVLDFVIGLKIEFTVLPVNMVFAIPMPPPESTGNADERTTLKTDARPPKTYGADTEGIPPPSDQS